MKNNTDLSKIGIELENLDLSNVNLGFSEFLSNNDIQAKMSAQFWSLDSKKYCRLCWEAVSLYRYLILVSAQDRFLAVIAFNMKLC